MPSPNGGGAQGGSPPLGAGPSGGSPTGGSAAGGSAAGGSAAGGSAAGGEGGVSLPDNPDPTCVADLTLPSGTVEDIAADIGLPGPIVLSGNDLYFTEYLQGGPSYLSRIPKKGGVVERVATAETYAAEIAISNDAVFWGNWDELDQVTPVGSVGRLALADDSTTVALADLGQPHGMAFHAGDLYVTDTVAVELLALRANGATDLLPLPAPSVPYLVAVDDGGIYVAAIEPGFAPNLISVFHLDRDGNGSTIYTLDPAVGNLTSITLDGDWLYLMTDAGIVMRGTRDGGPLKTLAYVQNPITAAVVRDCFVYFTSSRVSGAVARVPVQGGEVQDLANAVKPQGIAVDDDTIYWTSKASTGPLDPPPTTGFLRRRAK